MKIFNRYIRLCSLLAMFFCPVVEIMAHGTVMSVAESSSRGVVENSSSTAAPGADSLSKAFSYVPVVKGVLRGRFEQSVETGEGRFQVRNARVSVEGRVAPIISYKLQVDFCDRGSVKPLDAWGAIDVIRGLNFRVGQFRQPFGKDCFRGPANYIFANRSFLAKNVANVRGVGVQGAYRFAGVPLRIAASVFNPTGISDHDKWVKKYAYAGQLSYTPGFGGSGINSYGRTGSSADFAIGMMSLRPENVRMNIFGVSAGWSAAWWLVEGEYMHEVYTNGAAPAVNAFSVFVDRGWPVRLGDFNRWSVQTRFDSMTRHSDGKADDAGQLVIDQNTRSRLTLGTTLTYVYRRVRADIRLNYEQYFYGHGGRGDEEGSRLVAELVVSF